VLVASRERLSNFMQFLPTISAKGDANFTSNSKGLVGKPVTYTISINATMSLFEGGTRLSQLRENSLKSEEASIRLGYLRREIATQIRGRKEKLAELKIKVQAADLKVSATKELKTIALGRYGRGLIPQEELLKVIEDNLEAQVIKRKSQADLNTEKLALTYEAGLLTPQFVR